MKKARWIIILVNVVVLMVFFNNSTLRKETLLSDGKLILLELEPVDPRSLMQGDYMRLRYAIADSINKDSISKRGFCVIRLDKKGVAKRVRLQKERQPRYSGEELIEYTLRHPRRINIGAESFFFQEGEAGKYEAVKYGGVKVDDEGHSLLIGLYDENLDKIE